MILTRGARITGSVLCAVLASVVVCWIVRDLRAVGEPLDLLRHWAGFADARPAGLPVTTRTDLALLAVCAAVFLTASRSPVAAAAMVATGVVTFALRLPSVWTIGASWTDGRHSDELRTRALVGTFVTLAAALALIVTGTAGRRQPLDVYEPLPTRPGQGAGTAAFLVFGASAAVLGAWEIHYSSRMISGIYTDWLLGGRTVPMGLTDAPPGWANLALVALCLVVAWSALLRAVHTRPLGMIAGAFLLLLGGLDVLRSVHHEVLEHFGDLATQAQLAVLTSFFYTLTGTVGLLALSRRGLTDPGVQDPYGGYGHPPPPGHGHPPAEAAGYGPAAAGGPDGPGRFGPAPGFPPPPGPPPPGW
ncbi:hypothetical protein OG909_21545 [Streptomyces sp. NBC_01754]|uniref:hypothetical protein n=1 Tax=Streptomyces sp. NBC_01754 TaxID=2975930 RepID=UPI002DDC1196|nr:hypothetical protein [Streptomyces sp. NBC_01754]WSC94651.1 hypothetical protein OG909_21545 [Streptomyces sp. NBC_01754]